MNNVRDVYFSDLRTPGVILGGLVSSRGITGEVFYIIVAIVIGRQRDATGSHDFHIQDKNGHALTPNDIDLRPGHYLVVSDKPAELSNARFLVRGLSGSTGTRLESFRREVRARDGRCVITKEEAIDGTLMDRWTGFEVAHIVPIAYAGEWRQRNFSQHITVFPPPPRQNDAINSVQNGLLLRSDVHQKFDAYGFSILPEANHRIISFTPGSRALAGTYLDRQLLDDARRPPDALFRWHFEQAVLCNVRGAGEPAVEFDFPPGSDMMGELSAGPKAAERMEFELFTRLGAAIPFEDKRQF